MLKRFAVPVVIILVLVAAMTVLNKGIDRNAQDDGDRDLAAATGLDTDKSSNQDQQQQQQQQQADSGAIDQYPTESVFGNFVKPKYNVQLGWYYDEKMMSTQPSRMDGIMRVLSAWAMSKPTDYAAVMVDLDTPTDDRSPTAHDVSTLGLTVNGKLVKAGNAGTDFTEADVTRVLASLK